MRAGKEYAGEQEMNMRERREQERNMREERERESERVVTSKT